MTQVSSASLYRHRAKVWLITAGVLGVLWVGIWLTREEQARAIIGQKSSIASEPALPSHIDSLNDFAKEVPRPSPEVATKELKGYPAEFKDKRFLLDNKGKWTVQVMDVFKSQSITDYLETRADRNRFAYFRYLDAQGREKYILTYGIMHSFQEALGAAKIVDFKSPESSRPLPESIDRYLDIIDNYVYDGEKDAVNLEKTDKLEPAKLPKAEKPSNDTPEMSEELPAQKPKKAEETDKTTTDKKEPKTDKTDKADKKEDKPKEQPVGAVDTSELAPPPTIRPTAEAQSKAQPVVPLNQAPPTFEGEGQ